MNDTISGCCPHQSESANVHSRARLAAQTSWQAPITAQYMSPVTIGESVFAVTASMSSSSAREAARDVALAQQDAPLVELRAGQELGVGELLRDLHDRGRDRSGFVEIAAADRVFHRGQQQVAALGARGALRLHEPLGARKPAAGSAAFAAKQQAQAEPERAAHALQAPALIEMRVVSALEQREIVVVAAGEVGGRGEPLEIVGAKLAGAVRGAERVEREQPRALGVMLPCLIELGAGGGLHWRFLSVRCLAG